MMAARMALFVVYGLLYPQRRIVHCYFPVHATLNIECGIPTPPYGHRMKIGSFPYSNKYIFFVQ